MGSRSKIVGINREEAETTFEVDEKAIALGNQEDAAEALILGEEDAFAGQDWDEEYLDPAPSRNWFTIQKTCGVARTPTKKRTNKYAVTGRKHAPNSLRSSRTWCCGRTRPMKKC